MKKKILATASYEDYLIDSLRDAEEAEGYLNAALEDEDFRVFLLALRDVAEAHGIGNLAAAAELNRENIYRMLSERGNPCLSSIFALLRAMSLRVSINSAKSEEKPPRAVESSAAAVPNKMEFSSDMDFTAEVAVDYVPRKSMQPAFLQNFRMMNVTGKQYPVQVYELQTA